MKFKVFATGSKGNISYFSTGEKNYLIDCGKSYKEIQSYLAEVNLNFSSIDGIFITHTHKDHILGLKKILSIHQIPIISTQGIINELLEKDHLIYRSVYLNIDELFKIDDVAIGYTLGMSHDSPTIGFVFKKEHKKLVYVTDTGYFNLKKYRKIVSNAHAYVFESNYCPKMLINSKYPQFLKNRIVSNSGHLSNHDSAVALSSIIGENTKEICLIHLSDENNCFDQVLSTFETVFTTCQVGLPKLNILKQGVSSDVIEID